MVLSSFGDHIRRPMREKNFIFYLPGAKVSDADVRRFLKKEAGYGDGESIFFKLGYTPPYQKFFSIREFQCEMRYRPFEESNKKMAAAVIDLTEWIGHEDEEYLEIFFQYLHDFDCTFHSYEFVFTVSDADREQTRELLLLAAEYLGQYRVEEDRTLNTEQALAELLQEEYPVDQWVAKRLAKIFLSGKGRDFAKIRGFMNDFVAHVKNGKRGRITVKEVMKHFSELEESKIGLFYEKELAAWKEEYILCVEKENVA